MKVLLVLSLLVLSLSAATAGDSQAVGLEKMINRAAALGHRAAFVFDLDETLVDSTPRRFAALQDAVNEICGAMSAPAPSDCPALRALSLATLYGMRNRYDDHAYLRSSGVKDDATIEAVSKASLTRYLSGDLILGSDRLMPGAQAYVRELKRLGAEVYFVTSRSIVKQGAATAEFLSRRGLLREGEESFLYLKPDAEKSPDFKRRATSEILALVDAEGGRVEGIFENEPENLAIWIDTFPTAKAFFMEGAYQHEGPVASKAVLLRDFWY